MPIYTYKCKNCGRVTEKFKSMNSNGSEKCEYCSSETSRVFSPAGIIFKGSGFYTTDYKSNSPKPASSASSKTDEKGIKKDSSKTETSSDNKNDSKSSPVASNTDPVK